MKTTVPMQKSIRFFMMMLPTFFARVILFQPLRIRTAWKRPGLRPWDTIPINPSSLAPFYTRACGPAPSPSRTPLCVWFWFLCCSKEAGAAGSDPTAPLLECEFIPPVLSCQDAGRKFVGPNQNAGRQGRPSFLSSTNFLRARVKKEREAFLKNRKEKAECKNCIK